MKPYAVYLRIEAAELLKSVAAQNRRGIENFVDSLSANPFKTGDYTETDAAGRPIQIKILGNFAVAFWADHAVKEIKVVAIVRADRP
ncbi:MAG: hypothetical protein ACKOD5_04075 [Chthoniobacterales bacterium]